MAVATVEYVENELRGLKEDLEALKNGVSLRKIVALPDRTTREQCIDRMSAAISRLEQYAKDIQNGKSIKTEDVDLASWPI
jgi:hypothetical protein